MKTKIRKIGNSCGVILTKSLLKQAQIEEEVTLSVDGSKIIIEAVQENPRKNWKEQLLKVNASEDKETFFDSIENDFDQTEWTW